MKFAALTLKFLQDESGPTAVEYAVMLALVLVAVMTAITSVGNTTLSIWTNNSEKITTAINSAS